MTDTTRIVQAVETGQAPPAALFEAVYEPLRSLAGRYLRDQRPGHTLQPTALVNEAFLRLVDQSDADWRSRAHFLAVAARAMRQILIDHARHRGRQKRGGGAQRITLDPGLTPARGDEGQSLLEIDELIDRLAGLDERQASIVEMRFFGGLTVEEVAHVLSVSKATVESDWRMARAWLRREIGELESSG